MRKILLKKIICINMVFITTMLLCISIVGCTVVNNKDNTENRGGNDNLTSVDNVDNSTNEIGMGRYVEKTVLEQSKYNISTIRQMSNGQLMMYSRIGKYISKDNGDSWENEDIDWLEEFNQKNNLIKTDISSEGSIIIVYEEDLDVKSENNNEDENVEVRTLYLDDDLDINCLLVKPDNTQTSLKLNFNGSKANIWNVGFNDSERLFGNEGNTMYEININDGNVKELFKAEGNIRYFQGRGDLLLCVTYDAICLYDMSERKIIEDKVLQEFVKDNYGKFRDYGSGFNFYVFFGEENTIYIAGQKGLHRHVIGGSLVEQIIDGNLSSLSNPAHYICNAAMIDNQEFLINYNDGKTVKCTYSETIPTIPSKKLTVYSLEENDTIRQAISMFQTKYPDMYITYVIGMEGGEITREDALRNLSTELLSNNGPDILVLDNMPYESYADKGVLMDLSDMVQNLNEEKALFTNLLEPLYIENNLYIVPIEFQIPVVFGHQNTVEMIDDLSGMADALEKLRKENPNARLVKKCSELGIMKSLSIVCAPSWEDADGNIDENTLREYLIQCKRIYDTQISGISNKEIQSYYEFNDLYLTMDGVKYEESKYFNWMTAGDYLCKNEQLVYGVIYDYDSYTDVLSAAKIQGFEDTKARLLNGQSKNVYCPLTLASVNANTKNSEKSLLFLRELLEPDVQKYTHNGYPINIKAFEENLILDDKDIDINGVYLTHLMNADDGSIVTWDAYVLDEKQKQQLIDWVHQIDTPYIMDIVFEQIVYDIGVKYLDGELELDTAVEEILSRLKTVKE